MRLLLRYHWARLRWIVRTSDTWWGFTHPGLAVRSCTAPRTTPTISPITHTDRGEPQWTPSPVTATP